MTKRFRLLGIAASLRNARWGAGKRALLDQIVALSDKEALLCFLKLESELHLENFVNAGRNEGRDFNEIYANLKKSNGEVGLSNSEVALAAALWAAHREGVEIDHVSLAEHYTAGGELRRPEELRRKLLAADGVLVSGPVYFGDRGSLTESLVDLIGTDQQLMAWAQGRLYGGITIGAKRNGGQETTLIYQMLDMLDLGFLGVGNDHETTAQYGGTGHAGDVGTMHKDLYGIDTSMGVGRRMARVLHLIGPGHSLSDRTRALFLVLRDSEGRALRAVESLAARHERAIAATIIDVANRRIKRCIACDICPTHIDVDASYRCIIASATDDLEAMHEELLNHDVIVPVVAAVHRRDTITSNYQNFIERTRYLRRGDYVLSDAVVAPLTVEEPGARNSYSIRMLTSFLRHHTVLSRPLFATLSDLGFSDTSELDAEFRRLISLGDQLAAGRLAEIGLRHASKYNPVGYVLSANKDLEDERLERRRRMVEARERHLGREAIARLPAVRHANTT